MAELTGARRSLPQVCVQRKARQYLRTTNLSVFPLSCERIFLVNMPCTTHDPSIAGPRQFQLSPTRAPDVVRWIALLEHTPQRIETRWNTANA